MKKDEYVPLVVIRRYGSNGMHAKTPVDSRKHYTMAETNELRAEKKEYKPRYTTKKKANE